MRTIFSLRFVAAVAVLVGLAVVAGLLFLRDDPVAEIVEAEPPVRRIELVELIFAAEPNGFAMSSSGVSVGELDLVLDGERTVRIAPGTVGEVTCGQLEEIARCAIVADMLGNAVVWFRIAPIRTSTTVEFPAIVSLDSNLARLEDGLELPYAPRLTRRCDRDFDSFRQFQQELGTDFTSIYSLTDDRITEVICTP
ncbi:MAG: hypothetical protein MUE78_01955 [Ilumatobacteraceae bacterium]|nr:hypothetical protein [Ilumatobacteraceae bacterium]